MVSTHTDPPWIHNDDLMEKEEQKQSEGYGKINDVLHDVLPQIVAGSGAYVPQI